MLQKIYQILNLGTILGHFVQFCLANPVRNVHEFLKARANFCVANLTMG